jgi:DNA-directed RNA polymerase specialized sigma24 family protein
VLRFYEDLTEEQVARAMGVNIGTVKSQTAKALRSLRGTIPSPRPDPDLSTGRRHD